MFDEIRCELNGGMKIERSKNVGIINELMKGYNVF